MNHLSHNLQQTSHMMSMGFIKEPFKPNCLFLRHHLAHGTILPKYSNATRPQMTIYHLTCRAERPGSDLVHQLLFLLERIKSRFLVFRDQVTPPTKHHIASHSKLGNMPMSTQREKIILSISRAKLLSTKSSLHHMSVHAATAP